jgi:uncharacterized membrane protein
MSKIEDFLTAAEEAEVVEAIRLAEKNTSGEIRVHLEKHTSIDLHKRAIEVFFALKMDNTKDRNGVLIYVAVNDKKFAIYGDKGINEKVPSNFWDSTKDSIIENLKKGKNKVALVEGITKAGEQLKTHFPYQIDDIDELSNDISKGAL